jgi:flagellar hook-basal body complex protein FliE
MISGIGIFHGIGKAMESTGALRAEAGFAAAMDVGSSFATALADAATSTIGKLQHAEQLSVQALQGGDIQTRDVVDAVMNAEQSLQAAVAIRDKIISAYLEVSRMAI